jgi:hypothetical protein
MQHCWGRRAEEFYGKDVDSNQKYALEEINVIFTVFRQLRRIFTSHFGGRYDHASDVLERCTAFFKAEFPSKIPIISIDFFPSQLALQFLAFSALKLSEQSSMADSGRRHVMAHRNHECRTI